MIYYTGSDGAFYAVASADIKVPADSVQITEAQALAILAESIVPPTKAELIKKVDADVDAIYAAAIGNRATEYSESELQANAFKDAAYSGTVPSYVASWLVSNTKGLTTAQEAADDIIAQADAWRGAAASIRANRLTAKKNIIDEVPTAMQQWNGFVTAIRAALGI